MFGGRLAATLVAAALAAGCTADSGISGLPRARYSSQELTAMASIASASPELRKLTDKAGRQFQVDGNLLRDERGRVIATLRGSALGAVAEVVAAKGFLAHHRSLLQVAEKVAKRKGAPASRTVVASASTSYDEDAAQRAFCDQMAIDIYSTSQQYFTRLRLWEQELLSYILLGIYDPYTGEFAFPNTYEVIAFIAEGTAIIALRNQLNMMATIYNASGCHAYHGNNDQ